MSGIVDISLASFVQRLNTEEGKTKTAALGQSWIRDRLREVSAFRKIIPPQTVDPSECQVMMTQDTIYKVVEVEPNSRAMVIDFRGQPTTRVIRAPRVPVGFYTISSEKFEKTEQELLAYTMPLTKIIEENAVFDLQDPEDRQWTLDIEAGIQFLQTEVNTNTAVAYNATNIRAGNVNAKSNSVVKGELALASDGIGFDVLPVQRPDYANLFKLFSRKRLRCARVLLTEPDFDSQMSWTVEDVGDKIQSETLVDGYQYDRILGREFVRTIKTDIVREGVIYGFAAPEFFGKFFILNQTKFYIDKIANVISWQCWEDIGGAVINVEGAKKLECFQGSVRPTATDVGFEVRLPSEEEALSAENNRVDAGAFFPNIKIL